MQSYLILTYVLVFIGDLFVRGVMNIIKYIKHHPLYESKNNFNNYNKDIEKQFFYFCKRLQTGYAALMFHSESQLIM